MAENKKSFLLYCDTLSTIEKLSDEQAGKLFRHLLRYVNDLNPEPPDFVTELAFEPIKQSLKRDLKRYESIVEKRREAGRLGGKQKVANLANASKSEQNVANVAVIDSDSDSDSVIDNDILLKKETKELKEKLFNQFWESYQKKVGKPNTLIQWNKLTIQEMEKIVEVCPKYISYHQDPKFRKDPERFLKHKSWEDELIASKPILAKSDGIYADLNKNYKEL